MVNTQLSSKFIQPLRSMEPCRILKTLHKSKICTSYLVAVKLPGNQKETNILQVFSAEAVQAYESAEAAIRCTRDPDQMECIKGIGDIRYIFLKNNGEDLLTWKKISAMSLMERTKMILAIADQMRKLEDDNILLNGTELKHAQYNSASGTASFWDFSCAVIADAGTSAQVRRACHSAAVKKLAEFAYCAIMGKACAKENAQIKLLMTLCHKLPEKHLSKLLDTFDQAFSDRTQVTLAQFIEMLKDTQKYLLESRSKRNARGKRDACILAAADFLDKNPLYPYVQEDKDGNKKLKVVLVGKSPMRMAFFNTIFSCAQMLDTQMHIHIMANDADKFYDRCITEAPLLKKTTEVTHIPDRTECTHKLNVKITGKDRSGNAVPFAYLTFEKTTEFPNAEKLAQSNPGCVFLLDEYSDEVSSDICKYVSNNRRSLLLGICNPEPIRYDCRSKNGCLKVRSFTRTGASYRRRPLTQSAIYQKALEIHTFFCKGGEQRISREKILEQFRDIYYRDSSLRNVLSIPYKLQAYQLNDCERVSELFAETVLTDRAKSSRLEWLEHRSWQAHLITRGWTVCEDKCEDKCENTLKDRFSKNQFKHQNREEKWHACLLGRNDSQSSDLEQWTIEDWKTRDILKLDLEPLDWVSVTLHRILVKAVDGDVKTKLDDCLKDLQKELSGYLFQQVDNAVNRLRDEVPNAEIVWKRLLRELPENKTVEDLCTQVQHLIDRNRRRNYKTSDWDVIEAIPYLLRDTSIQYVYKLCADQPWDNVAVSTFVEPQELILLTDTKHTITQVQQEHIANFLQDRRSMEISVHAELLADNIQIAGKNAVLDITGATAEQVIMAQQHPVLCKLPLVGYSGGKLVNPDGRFKQIRFYPMNKSLTVEETMALTGTKVSSENIDIPMHRLNQYREMWKATQSIEDYGFICGFLATLRTTCKVYRDHDRWITKMSNETAKKYGVSMLLNDLKKKGIVKYESIQEVYVQNGLFCKCKADGCWCDLLEKLEKMIHDGEIPENCRFYVEKDRNPRINNWYVKWYVNREPTVLFTLMERGPWFRACSKAEAEKIGLISLLKTLKSSGIVASFGWNDRQKLEVRAADPYCQTSLNNLLNTYMNAPDAKREQLKLHFVTDDPNAFCVLDDMSLEVSQTSDIKDNMLTYSNKTGNWKLAYNRLEAGLAILSGNGLISKNYRISKNNKPGSVEKAEIRFSYTDDACLDCLTKAGNSLEALAYHTIRQMGIFDDVKLGVSIFWNDQKANDKDTNNEIDIVCTKGTKTYFISCKNTAKIRTEYLTEIRYETDRFGVDGTAILLTTAPRQDSEAAYLRAQHMGIKIIPLQKFAAQGEKLENSERVLQDALVSIVQKHHS